MKPKQRKAIAKVDAREASFSEWFVAQYGSGPGSDKDVDKLYDQVQEAEGCLTLAKSRVRAAVNWRDLRDAALKAWQASRDQRGKVSK